MSWPIKAGKDILRIFAIMANILSASFVRRWQYLFNSLVLDAK